jgi:hypothetical protein
VVEAFPDQFAGGHQHAWRVGRQKTQIYAKIWRPGWVNFRCKSWVSFKCKSTVERLIGTVRRELIDQTLFWTATDLEKKLRDYQAYYNEHRCHSSRDGATPIERDGKTVVDIHNYRWKKQLLAGERHQPLEVTRIATYTKEPMFEATAF